MIRSHDKINLTVGCTESRNDTRAVELLAFGVALQGITLILSEVNKNVIEAGLCDRVIIDVTRFANRLQPRENVSNLLKIGDVVNNIEENRAQIVLLPVSMTKQLLEVGQNLGYRISDSAFPRVHP